MQILDPLGKCKTQKNAVELANWALVEGPHGDVHSCLGNLAIGNTHGGWLPSLLPQMAQQKLGRLP